jgi:hypothetical protein
MFMGAEIGILIVETIAKIRRLFFVHGKPVKAICRELRLPRIGAFEGAPRELHLPELAEGGDTIASDLGAFLATSDGVALVKAYTRIEDPKVRRAIVALVEQIVAEPAERAGIVPDARAVVAVK